MQLFLYTRDGCHLCDRLERLIAPHLARRGATLVKRNIMEADDWYEMYWSRVPVLTLDERVVLEGNPPDAEVQRVMREVLR